MTLARTLRTPSPALAEAWWPVEDVAPSGSRVHDDHVESGWWDPGDPARTRLRQATALVDELLASLPAEAVAHGALVVELGCGPGSGLQELAARWPCELHAWDAGPVPREHARFVAPGATVHDVAAPPLPLPAGAADVVWVPRSLAAGATGWEDVLAEAHRLLRPGGRLVAVHAGPGVWAWEPAGAPWDEDGTGRLALRLWRADEHGGPVAYTSAWWRREHWGRGFALELDRPAGVAMTRPDQGHGLSVWRRADGPPLAAAAFAAVAPGDVREGRALRRQLALAGAEARALAERRTARIAAAAARLERLERPDAVDDHPRLRALRGGRP